MEENYRELIEKLQDTKNSEHQEHILVVDGLNLFIRCFSAIRTLNSDGYHIGGLLGFLKSLACLVRTFHPDRTVVCWDGKGGSQSRKNLNPNYKGQRDHASVIHWDIYDSKEDEIKSMGDQIDRVFDYLRLLPVYVVDLPRLEADDIIAYISNNSGKSGRKVTIVSSDKDFLQLVTENVRVYSPTKKILYDYSTATSFLQVLPENYNIVKALVGDNSDNLRGIRGAGVKTLNKIFPGLAQDRDFSLQDLYDTCAASLQKKAIYANIINGWDDVELNYKLMNLQETILSQEEKDQVKAILSAGKPQLKVGLAILLLEQDKLELSTVDSEQWLTSNFL